MRTPNGNEPNTVSALGPTAELDPALPELALAFDLAFVASRLEEVWRRANGDVTVSRCLRVGTRYDPGTRCVVVYDLAGEGPHGVQRRTIGVVEIDSSAVTPRLFRDDPKLHGLRFAADGETMVERFAALPGASRIRACTVTPVRYQPGRSCVLRYDLETAAGERGFFGKVVAEGANELASLLATLHEASLAEPRMPRIPAPIAYWPDLQLAVQAAVPDAIRLGAQAFDPSSPAAARSSWMRRAGAAIAAFHRAVTTRGRPRTVEDDVRELRESRSPLAQIAPELLGPYDDAVAAVSGLARRLVDFEQVGSHGALRADQFLIGGDEIFLVDLDAFCRADPARDVGNLLAYLEWKAIRRPRERPLTQAAWRAFLDGYAQVARAPGDSSLSLYRAASMLKIAARRFRRLSFEEWPLVPKLLDAVWATLNPP